MTEQSLDSQPKRGRPRKRFDLSDPKDLAQLTKRIRISYFKKIGRSTPGIDVEDVVGEVLKLWVSGRRKKATIDQIVIDAVRNLQNIGRKTNKKGQSILQIYEHRRALTNAIPFGDAEYDRFKRARKVHPQYFENEEFDRIVALVPASKDRMILRLLYKYNFTKREVMELIEFPASESRFSQIVAGIHFKLKKQIKSQGGADEFK